ncbi:MAG: phosphoglycerate kinase [Gammaproteobacteria bacterium]|nr:phosphoglycerate kinase [Gammaproteobacteria bacterium]
MSKLMITDLELKGKKVLVRVDFNVPMKGGVITDDNRIVQALPTIKYVIENGGKAILFSHLGRVKSEEDKAKSGLAPVAKRLEELLGQHVEFVPATRGKALEDAINNLKNGEVLMFENTRFEDVDGKKESKCDPELGKYWASLGDVFVNDAFGTAHRAHASNVGISSNIKQTAAGFLMEKELKFIGGAVDNPVRPFVAILGGAKVSDKISVIENLLSKADKVLICGAMSYTFFKALGYEVGDSKCEPDFVEYAKGLLDKANGKIVLPVDTVVAQPDPQKCAEDFFGAIAVAPTKVVASNAIPAGWQGLDCGPKTVEEFKKILSTAKTVVWNGPAGVFEVEKFAKGTIAICEALANLKDVITIIGGGDSASAAINLGYASKFTHISTGGGASLEYLEGKVLPGVAAISDK